MKSYQVLPLLIMLALAPLSALLRAVPSEPPVKPNIIYILLDDAGIGDFSAYGCKYGVTPNIDRLATEGMKFTRAYSGSAVCAPSRMVLMTGQHTGHILRRANQSKIGLLALPAGQTTVARMLQNAGYATGGFGKWGLGNPETTGVAEKQGFDVFFGYYDQKHAHNHYTDYLIRNSVKVPIQQSGKHTWADYAPTRIADETLSFIEQNKDRPFFCYAASGKPWPEEIKNYAAMVALADRDVGRVMQKLKDLGLDDRTLVIFSSDNGANPEFIEPLGSTGGLRGHKRMLYEGGTRTPLIVRWPGKIQPGTTSDLLTAFVDFLPTAAELSGLPAPKGIDGHSIVPTLLGKGQQTRHESLYFEIYEPYFQQAVRMGDWKGYRLGTKAPLELYDLKADPAEKQNIAAAHPDIVRKVEAIMKAEHSPSPYYDAPEQGSPRPTKGKNEQSAKPAATSKENPSL